MSGKTEKTILRVLFVPFSAYFLFSLLSNFVGFLNNLAYNLTEDSYDIFMTFETRENIVLIIFGGLLTVHIALEIGACFSRKIALSKTLTHFRYAPIAIMFFSLVIVIIYDLGMIEYSKYRIRKYVFSASQSLEPPDLSVHNNYRHWCGNGAIAQENYLYFETASEGRNDENPYVRSRSLLMSADVQNLLNGGDERFNRFLAESCSDASPIVRDTAEQYLVKSNRNCRHYVSSR